MRPLIIGAAAAAGLVLARRGRTRASGAVNEPVRLLWRTEPNVFPAYRMEPDRSYYLCQLQDIYLYFAWLFFEDDNFSVEEMCSAIQESGGEQEYLVSLAERLPDRFRWDSMDVSVAMSVRTLAQRIGGDLYDLQYQGVSAGDHHVYVELWRGDSITLEQGEEKLEHLTTLHPNRVVMLVLDQFLAALDDSALGSKRWVEAIRDRFLLTSEELRARPMTEHVLGQDADWIIEEHTNASLGGLSRRPSLRDMRHPRSDPRRIHLVLRAMSDLWYSLQNFLSIDNVSMNLRSLVVSLIALFWHDASDLRLSKYRRITRCRFGRDGIATFQSDLPR